MRIALIQPPIEDFYTTPIRLYPLGLLYVASLLETHGHTVYLIDALNPLKKRTIALPPYFHYLKPYVAAPYFFKGYYRFGLFDDEIIEKVKQIAPSWIGISSNFTAYYKNVEELAIRIKEKLNIPIVIGGNHATTFANEIRHRTPKIDLVAEGPAEISLIKSLLEKGLLTEDSVEEQNWQQLQPAHHLLVEGNYCIGKQRSVSLIASRGCPYSCEFCSVHQMFGHNISYRRIEDVMTEMNWLRQHYRVKIFNFEDDNLTFDKNWFKELMLNIATNPAFNDTELTAMNGICYPTLDEEMLHLMYQAGFRQLNLSMVTRDVQIRAQYRRPEKLGGLEQIIRIAQKLGFFITVYIIIGLPGQNYQEVKESMDYLFGLGVLVGPSIFYIPPASNLYEKLSLPQHIRDNWNLYRSSAFAVETEQMTRDQLVKLFIYSRTRNLANK